MKRIFTAFMMMLCAVCAASAANYLTFTAEEDSSSFGIVHTGDNNPDVQYSLDDGATWTVLAGGDTVTLAHKGDKALLRGDNPEGFSKSRDQYSTFRMTGKVSASGSVMSLIDGTGLSTEIPNGYCFCRSFRSCTSLTRAPELPATTLTAFCYDAMFLGCTSLTQVPALPATTLANYCYDGMFSGCTSLTQAPELPVVTLVGGCYYSMFSDCASLTQAPALPATTLADSCYMYMFSGCTGLTQAPELPATTLASYCYYSMFKGCASLSQAPALPATTLAHDCYKLMFEGCSSLTQAPELPATTLDGNCTPYACSPSLARRSQGSRSPMAKGSCWSGPTTQNRTSYWNSSSTIGRRNMLIMRRKHPTNGSRKRTRCSPQCYVRIFPRRLGLRFSDQCLSYKARWIK